MLFLVIVLIFYSATVAVSIANVRNMSGQMKDMYDGPFDNVQTSLELVANLQTVGRNITVLTATDNVIDESKYIKSTKEIIEKVESGLEKLASGYINDEEAIAELKVLFAELSVPRDRIIEYIEQGNDDEALALYVNSYLPKVEIVKQKLESVANSCVEDARNSMNSTQADNSRVLMFMIGLGVVVIILTLVLWVVFTRSILRPILCVKTAANAIALGDLDVELDYRSANELGQLAEDFTWDALKELGNIGTGNAMNALYELSGHFVDIDYPRLRLIKYQNIFEILETAEVLQTGIMVGLFGDARGVFLFMLDERFTSALLNQALQLSVPVFERK